MLTTTCFTSRLVSPLIVVLFAAILGLPAMAQGGSISGNVYNFDMTVPLDNIPVNLYDAGGNLAQTFNTDTGGFYTFGGLADGIYYVATNDQVEGFFNEVFDDIKCEGCDVTLVGMPIMISGSNAETGISFALDGRAILSGTVYDASATPIPLDNIRVELLDSDGILIQDAVTMTDGTFMIGGIDAGTYYLSVPPQETYVPQIYNLNNCQLGCFPSDGNAINVVNNDIFGSKDFFLQTEGTITGTLTDETTNNPIVGATVWLTTSAKDFFKSHITATDGSYQFGNLTDGDYLVYTDAPGYLDENWNNKPCSGGCSPELGDPISVAAGSNTGNIDFALQPETTGSEFFFSNLSYVFPENASLQNKRAATIMVERSGDTSTAASVDLSYSDATATVNLDYLPSPSTVNFAATETMVAVELTIIDDREQELDEDFNISLTNPSAGSTIGTDFQTNVRILDIEEGQISFEQSQANVTEDIGTLVLQVTRFNGGDGNISVDIATTPGTATSGDDYDPVMTTLSWADGDQSARTVSVNIVNDNLTESLETFVVGMSNVVGNPLPSPNPAVIVNIQDPAQAILQWSQNHYIVNENEGTVTVELQRLGDLTDAISADVVSNDLSTLEGIDYTGLSQSISYQAGEGGSRSFTIPVALDSELEGPEAFELRIQNVVGNVVAGPAAIVEIRDSHPPTHFFPVDMLTISEDSGVIQIPVVRLGDISQATALTVGFADGSATDGLDYDVVNTTLSFPANDPQPQFVDIQLIDDQETEGPETFSLTLGQPDTGQVGTYGSITITIIDNEASDVITLVTPSIQLPESSGTAEIVVGRSGSGTNEVSATFTTMDGSATAGSDYTAVNTTVTFLAGDFGPKTVQIPILPDNMAEQNETVIYTLSNPTGGATLGTDQGILTIVDNPPGMVTINFAAFAVSESDGQVSIDVTRFGGSHGQISVDFATMDGTAIDGQDYNGVTRTLTFADGVEETQNIIIPILSDNLDEPTETFTVQLSNPTGGATISPIGQADIAITNVNPSGVTLSQGRYEVREDQTQVVVGVTRNGNTTGALSVDLSSMDGSATAESDYTAVSQTVSFAAGEGGTREIAIPILLDPAPEPPENFFLQLSNVNGGIIDPIAQSEVVIQDISAGEFLFATPRYEVAENGGQVVVEVLRVGGNFGSASVEIATSDGTATAPDDYTNITQTLTFPDGVGGGMTVAIPIIEDQQREQQEVFTASLANPSGGAVLGVPATAVVTILDNTPSVLRFEQPLYNVAEAQGEVILGVLLDAPTETTVSVNFGTDSDTATEGQDFTATSGQLVFPPGEIRQTISVPILVDTEVEAPENFQVLLENPSGAVLGVPATAQVVIQDLPPSTIFFGATSFTAEESSGQLGVIIQRAGPSESQASVLLTAENSGAIAGQDFDFSSQRINFESGDTSVTVNIPLIDDTDEENTELFDLTLSDPQGHAVLAPPAQARGIILDDDEPEPPPVVAFLAATETVSENGGKRAVSVQVLLGLDKPAEERVTANFSVGGTATPGSDHDLSSGNLGFTPGSTLASIDFTVFDDDEVEGPEIVTINLSSASGAQVGRPSSFVLTIEDDDRENRAPETSLLSPQDGARFREGETIVLQAAGSDPEGGALTFEWEICLQGRSCITRTASEPIMFNPPVAGVMRLAVRAVDPQGLADPTPATAQITILPPNAAPQATIVSPSERPLFVDVGQSVTFRAEASDPDMDDLTLEWFLAGTPNNTHPGATFSPNFPNLGTFVVTFRATDSQGNSDTDWIVVNVNEPENQPTRIAITSPADRSEVGVGQSIDLVADLQQNKTQKREFQFLWDLGDGRQVSSDTGQLNTSYSEPGRYLVHVFASDGQLRFQDSIILFVTDTEAAPEVDINLPSDIRLQPGNNKRATPSVYFQAPVIRSSGFRNLFFFWDFGNGQTSTAETPGEVLYPEPGTYTVKLFATTPSGTQSATVTRRVIVEATTDEQFEPNDSFGQAAEIVPGQYANQLLDSNSALDTFRIVVPRNGQTLQIVPTTAGGIAVSLFNSQQQLVARLEPDQSGHIQISGLEAGVYFLGFRSDDVLKLKMGLDYSFDVAVLNPSMFLTEIREDFNFTTEIGLINPNNSKTNVEVLAYNSSGNLVAKVPLAIEARGRTHQTLGNLFDDTSDIAWLRVDATADLNGYSLTRSRDGKEQYGITAAKELSSELFVPHIAERVEQWTTKASVINAQSEAAMAQLEAGGEARDLALEEAFARDTFDFLEKFDGTLPPASPWGLIQEVNGNISLAGAEVFGKIDGNRQTAGLALADSRLDNPNFTFVRNNLYFTHIARDTATFWTGIALVNVTNAAQGLVVKGFGPTGTEVGSKNITLEAGAKLVEIAETFLSEIGDPSTVDWVMVEADSGIVGFELFGTHDNKQLAGLEAANYLKPNLCYPYIDPSGSSWHGLSVVNVSEESNVVTFSVYDNNGQLLAQRQETLNPMQKFIGTFESLFPDIPADQIPGWVECEAQKPIAGFQLFGDLAGESLGAVTAQ